MKHPLILKFLSGHKERPLSDILEELSWLHENAIEQEQLRSRKGVSKVQQNLLPGPSCHPRTTPQLRRPAPG